MKTEWALICIHDGNFRTTTKSSPLDLVGKGELLTFRTKKEAVSFIKSNFSWALTPIKVYYSPSRWLNGDNYYHIVQFNRD